MTLPQWVDAIIRGYEPPFRTGQVIVRLELYNEGITKMEIGGIIRVKPIINKSMFNDKQTTDTIIE